MTLLLAASSPLLLLAQSIMLNNFDFTFATRKEDVGMKTGATIHTMNGLNMNIRKLDRTLPAPETSGWWEQQHLKRGLKADGTPQESGQVVPS